MVITQHIMNMLIHGVKIGGSFWVKVPQWDHAANYPRTFKMDPMGSISLVFITLH